MKEMQKKQFAPRKQSEAFPKLSLAQIAKIERIYRTTPLELIEGLWVCTACGDCKVRVGVSSPPKKCPACRGEVIGGLLFMEMLSREKK